jgi:tRNA(Ile)-lysidine synthetase-like protein
MLNRFLEALASLDLRPRSHVIIGLSGGLDSVALTHLFAQSQNHHHLLLELAHLSHNFRTPSETQLDKNLALQISQHYGLPLHLHSLSRENIFTHGKEQQARTLRRQWLQSLCLKPSTTIALAHHGDDQIETILMRLEQRYPLKGLSGIKKSNPPFIRPLLGFYKSELRQYLIDNNFSWHEDSTNDDLQMRRNQTRSMLASVQPVMPSLLGNLQHLGTLAHQHNSLVDHLLKSELEYSLSESDSFSYPYGRFVGLHQSIQFELIFYWFNQLMRGVVRADYRLPTKFLQNINLQANGATLLQGHGIRIWRKKSTLYITKERS